MRTTSDVVRASHNLTMIRLAAILPVMLLACASAFAQADAGPGPAPALVPAPAPAQGAAAVQSPAPTTQGHDRHDGMSILADSFADATRSKEKFGKANPVDAGVLPVEIIIHNETEQPIRVNLSTIQLTVRFPNGTRQDIGWLSAAEVATLIAHPSGSANPGVRRMPTIGLNIPGNDKKAQKLADILQPLNLDADVVPPTGTIHGFLYFDLNHQMSLASKASLYVPDAEVITSHKALMFFEVPLGEGQHQ